MDIFSYCRNVAEVRGRKSWKKKLKKKYFFTMKNLLTITWPTYPSGAEWQRRS